MNFKHSLFINKTGFLSAALLAFFAQALTAQTRYDKVMDLNFWNDGRNITGLRTESPVKVSYAEITGGFKAGDFKASNDGSSVWNAGAVAKTCTDLEKFSMAGSFSFNQLQGREMSGSMFINPGYYPVDVLEFTPGMKTLQTYSFTGGIAVPLNERWSIGGKMDFESDNYAKRKDIRHTNYRLDITLAPSVMLSLDGGWDLGLSYILNKTSESIQAEQIGTATASSYYAFLDKGMMYGSYQVWDGSGVHLNESGIDRFAVKELTNGAAFQLQRDYEGKVFYADLEWSFTNGEVGEKSYTFYKFPGTELSARAGFRSEGAAGINIFRLNYLWKRQVNNEYVIEKVASGGVTTPVTYGHNKIFERRILSFEPEYTFYGAGALSWLYKARAEAGITRKKEQSSLVYPYSYTSSSTVVSMEAEGVVSAGKFRFGAGVSWMKGLNVKENEHSAEGSGSSSQAFRLELWNNLDNEWDNAARIGADISLRYDFAFLKVRGLYAEAVGAILHGFNVSYAGGSDRCTGIFKIGYEF